MKRCLSLFFVVLLISVNVSATAMRISDQRPTITFSNNSALCRATVKSPGDHIEATLELRYGSQVLDTWSDSGIGYLIIDESYSPVYSGYGYSLRLYGSINGVDFPDVTVSGICP